MVLYLIILQGLASTDEHVKNLTSSGFHYLRSQSLTVDFSFASALKVRDEATGEEHQELFQFGLQLEASRIQAVQESQRVEKDDILHFARGIVNKLSKLHSEGKEIDGSALDDEALRELAAVHKGRLLKSILQIIGLMRDVDRMRGKHGEHVRPNPERSNTLVTEGAKLEAQSLKLSLRVNRLSSEAVQASEEELPLKEDAVRSTPDQPTHESAAT